MLLASEVAAVTGGGIDIANLELWVVLTNVAIVVATLMLTKATVKDAQLHEEKMVNTQAETTKDLTEIVHDVLVQEGRLMSEHSHHESHAAPAEPAEQPEPLHAVK